MLYAYVTIMEAGRTKRRILPIALVVALPIAAIASYFVIRSQAPQYFADNQVYGVQYERPQGWTEEPPGPFTLFVFRHPDGLGTLRGSVNEVHAAVNPTPELDTNGIAEHYISLTEDNMPDWTAERMEDIRGRRERFSVIRRSKEKRTVYTAFCAKGNTTVVVSLSAGGDAAKSIDRLLPDFQALVASFTLTEKFVPIDD